MGFERRPAPYSLTPLPMFRVQALDILVRLGQGLWLEIADAGMRPLGQGSQSPVMDPRSIADRLPAVVETELRAMEPMRLTGVRHFYGAQGYGYLATIEEDGTLVVASAVGGIQDQIEDGVSGVLLKDPEDLDAFAGILADLLASPERMARLGLEPVPHIAARRIPARAELTEFPSA